MAIDTREGDVFETLLDKLEVQRQSLGDQVFDVLGGVLADVDLEELLARALAGADEQDIDVVLDRVSAGLEDAVRERAASISTLTPDEVLELRRDMEVAKASSLQPAVVQEFMAAALPRLRSELVPRGDYWQVRHVPETLRSDLGAGVKSRYDLVTFQSATGQSRTMTAPELVAPGHPLLTSVIAAVDERWGQALNHGTLLADDRTNEDYSLVTTFEGGGDETPSRLTTYRVRPGEPPTTVSTALYTSLPPAGTVPSSRDVSAVVEATERVLQSATAATSVVAVAQVQGIASVAEAESWRRAHAMLPTRLMEAGAQPDEIIEALPGQGWDYLRAGQDIAFVAGRPAEATSRQRRAEVHAAANVGDRYFTEIL